MWKKIIVIISMAGFIFGVKLFADIKGSHHDFSNSTWSNGEICRPCHTPQHANTEASGAPLWNHQVTEAVYELYSSTSLDAVAGQPAGISKLCLSCHDGTVAIENFGGRTSGTQYVTFGKINNNLHNGHPISFVYDDALAKADGNLHAPDQTPSGLGNTISKDLLVEGRLECSSCHDIHVTRNTEGCAGCHDIHSPGMTRSLSLKIPNNNSQLCRTCHIK